MCSRIRLGIGRVIEIVPPKNWNALLEQSELDCGQPRGIRLRLRRKYGLTDTICGQHAGGFADRPFAGMHAIRAGGEMGSTDVLARRDQVRRIGWDEASKRNLERFDA